MSTPELPIDEPIDTETQVDQEKLAAEVGCVAYHRYRDGGSRKRSSTFIASDVAGLVDSVLVSAEEYGVEYRESFVEAVIAGLREEMGK